ncbi:L-seryl-tRNA(Sec) selenium transferase [Bacillus luteus]|uniref:L-seryl-tRNA(Sec) selenium transferase n=2 Tax=Alkalicoccus luteus TaxID=1237094 RepID=A0A969PPK7_9BACI|nr:L-seryl-tRNA(Sec) selenium transferase [Alkalicoccus luteus]NJP37215.1 L-seryl-tRNA(Sec) selenium transferase [Alkalicoccus luteus]
MLRLLPSVNRVMEEPEVLALEQAGFKRSYVTELIQQAVSNARTSIQTGKKAPSDKTALLEDIKQELLDACSRHPFSLRRVINGTGTVLHTNLGRARLSPAAVRQMNEAAGFYSTLEYDLEHGKRGSRGSHVEELICKATGAEAAVAVNNNAAAVFFVLKALASPDDVLVSRGELVEIGGSFRVSSIMEMSGVQLKEVGTTNKTHLSDYLDSITENTSMIMKVHTSNFAIQGFTASVTPAVLKEAAGDRVIIYDDLGSGSLYDFHQHGIGEEPLIRTAVKNADIVSFSGDKLLGGPQAGVIAGKKKLIDQLRRHQLARVLRLDKATLAALEATLFEYCYGSPAENIPAVRDILATPEEIKARIISFLENSLFRSLKAEIVPVTSRIGGGTMPVTEIDSYALSVHLPGVEMNELDRMFRRADIPVVGRISQDQFLLDFRTVASEDYEPLAAALENLDAEK